MIIVVELLVHCLASIQIHVISRTVFTSRTVRSEDGTDLP